MKSRLRLAAACLAAASITTTSLANEPDSTIWSFLGIPQAVKAAADAVLNRNGNLPGLEPKPRLKSLADPANLEPGMPPAVQEAAKVKQQEDLKRQKIKAIKYLTQNACGCYDRPVQQEQEDGTVVTVKPITDALVASMQDCTEEVRLATVRYIAWGAQTGDCDKCGCNSCCNEAIVKELAKLAFEIDDKGCNLEPSERVRKEALNALLKCCPGNEPVSVVKEEKQEEPKPQVLPETGPAVEDDPQEESSGEDAEPNESAIGALLPNAGGMAPPSVPRTRIQPPQMPAAPNASPAPQAPQREVRGVNVQLKDLPEQGGQVRKVSNEEVSLGDLISGTRKVQTKAKNSDAASAPITVVAADRQKGLVQIKLPLATVYQYSQEFDIVRNDGSETAIARIKLVGPSGICRVIAGNAEAIQLRDFVIPR